MERYIAARDAAVKDLTNIATLAIRAEEALKTDAQKVPAALEEAALQARKVLGV